MPFGKRGGIIRGHAGGMPHRMYFCSLHPGVATQATGLSYALLSCVLTQPIAKYPLHTGFVRCVR